MNRARKLVLVASGVFLAVWFGVNIPRIWSDEDASIRIVLQSLFALIILFRRKTGPDPERSHRWILPLLAVSSSLLAVSGVVFRVHQFEWLGMIVLVYCCLRWALPARYSRDAAIAAFLLYWLHPLPGVLLGPAQLAMQKISVHGSEAALHIVNAPAWADGMVLRAGPNAFGVPESCSGFRTGVTVLLATMGVCLIFRMRWFETVVFLVLGLAQVLALNIARIVFTVIWAPRMPPEWANNFLHDTLGIFLLVSMVVVQGEALWWRAFSSRRKEAKRQIALGDRERPDRGSVLPRFWRLVLKWGWAAVLGLLVGGLVSLAAWKLRPTHRANMIARVVDDLIQKDPGTARRAAGAALAYRPGDRGLLSLRAQAGILEGEFVRGISEIDALAPPLSVFEVILKSWALMATGKAAEAITLVDSLPPAARQLPGVAIVRAEYAALRNLPEEVAANIVLAARSRIPMNRLRSLFPYMAAHEQWSAIAACDNPDVPYVTFAQALVSVYARIQTRDMAGAALALRQGLRQWPDDIRFLDSLFMLASLKPGGEWEGRFAATFRANLRGMDADMLASYINYCFRLARPDLAWMAYRRLQVVSPDDPALLLAPAQYGSEWFSIRRVSAGIVGRDQGSEADLRAAISQSCGIRPFAAAWKTIPLLDTILTVAPESIRREYVKKCLSELEKREARGELPIRMEMMFAVALAMDDRFQEAHDRLTSVEKRHPELRMDVLFQHLVLYDQEARWQDAYETGRICRAEGKLPNLTTDLLFVNAMMNLDLGMPAMAVLRAAAQDFPGVSSIVVAEAAIWDVFGYKEQALHVLSSAGGDTDNRMFPQLLYDTGRIREAEQKAGALGLQIRTSPPPRQMLAPEPAENVFLKKLPPPLTDAEMDQEAAKARQWLSASGSPFLERLTRLMLAYYASRGAEPSRRVEEWENGFRDDMEAGTALYRLALLCGRQGDMDTALRAVRASLGRAPDSAILWRIRLAFGDSGADVIGQAAKACPDDPEIWLASVVAGIRDKRGEEWAESVMRSAAASKRYSPGAMVRAGDFLFRCNMTGAAAIAARAAADRGAGLLSAQVLGYKCAMASKDWDWALSCALRGIEQAVDPAPFYKAVVVVKSVKKNPDADFVAALEYLRGQFPDEFKWSEQLALVYFQKGDMQRSLSILSPLIGGRLKGVRIQSVLVASEAARMEGEHIKAVGILETAHAVYPEKASILNNLVYNLAQDKATVSRAMELLPALVQMGGNNYAALDTAAVVYLRSGQLEKARDAMRRALAVLRDGDYAANEVKLNAAEVFLRSGDYATALRQVEDVRKDRGRSGLVENRARELLLAIEQGKRRR